MVSKKGYEELWQQQNRDAEAILKKKYPEHTWKCDGVVCYCNDCGVIVGLERDIAKLKKCAYDAKRDYYGCGY